MIVYFPEHDIIVNTETMTTGEVIPTSDRYPQQRHVKLSFVDGDYVEFPPESSLHQVFTTLTERSSCD